MRPISPGLQDSPLFLARTVSRFSNNEGADARRQHARHGPRPTHICLTHWERTSGRREETPGRDLTRSYHLMYLLSTAPGRTDMSPEELRSFRESLGMSRREFAPKLFVSEPTLERWERGQGGPRDVHVQILRRMREHLDAGGAMAYFRYDSGADDVVEELLRDDRRLIIESLRGMGSLLVSEKEDSRGQWRLCFTPGWSRAPSVSLALACAGSQRPERPAVDFILEAVLRSPAPGLTYDKVQDACSNHGIHGGLSHSRTITKVVLRHRTFNTACNPQTVRHIVGNLRSCWDRLQAVLTPPQDGATLTDAVQSATSSS